MLTEIEELLAKRYDNILPCERLRAQMAVQEITDIMHPKFDKQAEEEELVDDGEGYIDDYQWSADTLEEICAALYRNGFGPDSRIKHELKILGYGEDEDEDDKAEPEEESEDDEEPERFGHGEVTGLTDSEWDAIFEWAMTARDYHVSPPQNDESTEYWNVIIGSIKLRCLKLRDVEELIGWHEGFMEVEQDDGEEGRHTTAYKKLGRLLQAEADRNARG